MFAAILLTLASYVIYKLDGGWGLGPRYYFHVAGFLAIALAEGLSRIQAFLERGFPRRGQCIVIHLVLVGLCLNAGVAVARSVYDGTFVQVLKLPDQLVEEQGLRNAVVFINTEPRAPEMLWGAYGFTRNSPGYDGPVLYAVDRGEQNSSLMEQFPGRTFWRLHVDYARVGNPDRKIPSRTPHTLTSKGPPPADFCSFLTFWCRSCRLAGSFLPPPAPGRKKMRVHIIQPTHYAVPFQKKLYKTDKRDLLQLTLPYLASLVPEGVDVVLTDEPVETWDPEIPL